LPCYGCWLFRYSFSASGSVTISEFFKLLISSALFYRECARRLESSPDDGRTVLLNQWEENDKDHDAESKAEVENGEYSRSSSRSRANVKTKINARTFLRMVREELPTETRYGFAQLALFYVLINNTVCFAIAIETCAISPEWTCLICAMQVFILYKLADPGTIQLMKSGTTLITAVVSISLLGTTIVRGQWLAIVLQVAGIVVTQYNPQTGAAYPLSTYLVLLFQTTISAVSSVYNQKLCKSSDGSLHVMNMTLYAYGTCINFVLHLMLHVVKSNEPGFFQGYGSLGSIMVVLSNVFIGLAMTAVYKCKIGVSSRWHSI
jgi:drug/metabolite transporter (DMT)-like permease